MMSLKELYRRFRAWQAEPFHYEDAVGQHICANCGRSYEGDFCPVCGQKNDVGRVSWKSVGQEMVKTLGLESRSLLSSILQLLGRPGYLIGDYITGRRQVCYSPVSMLFVMAVIVTLILQLAGVKVVNEAAVETPSVNGLTSGLRKSACIIIPATPRENPVRMTNTALGNLPLKTKFE